MDFNERLLELLELEKTLESKLERIYETRQDLNIKETTFRQQLDFTRGQIKLLKELENKEESVINNSIVYKDLGVESTQIIKKSVKSEKSEQSKQEEKKEFDPFSPPTKKPAKITGMKFLS